MKLNSKFKNVKVDEALQSIVNQIPIKKETVQFLGTL